MAQPEKKFRSGQMTATVWKNTAKDNEGKEYETLNTTFEKSYKDKEGEWKTTNSLTSNDVPKAILVLQKAFEFISVKEVETPQ